MVGKLVGGKKDPGGGLGHIGLDRRLNEGAPLVVPLDRSVGGIGGRYGTGQRQMGAYEVVAELQSG